MVWSRKEDHANNDCDTHDYEKAVIELKRAESENVFLKQQLAQQTQFMQTVIMELITAIKEKPMQKSAVQSYLEAKQSNGPMHHSTSSKALAAKLP